MGKRGLPPLRRSEIAAILIAAGFVLKPGQGNNRHDVYEHGGIAGKRRTVPVARSHNEFSGWLLDAMIKQSGLTKKQFYGLTEATARKLQCEFLSNGLPAATLKSS